MKIVGMYHNEGVFFYFKKELSLQKNTFRALFCRIFTPKNIDLIKKLFYGAQ